MSRCKTNLVHGLRVLVIASFAISFAAVASAQDWYVNPANDHSYRLTEGSYYGAHDEPNPHILTPDWFDAEAEAQSYGDGAHLVTINDAAENQWLVDTFGTAHYWIGFTDHIAYSALGEGHWVWVSGEPVTYTNWDSGQPDNYRQGEDVAHTNHGGHAGYWNDLGNDNTHGAGTSTPFQGIVEMPPPVATTGATWGRIKATYR